MMPPARFVIHKAEPSRRVRICPCPERTCAASGGACHMAVKCGPLMRAGEFKERIPEIAQGLQGLIAAQRATNSRFNGAFDAFRPLCQSSVDPRIADLALDEMLFQHLLTERLFNRVFDNGDFIGRNVIAQGLAFGECPVREVLLQRTARDEFEDQVRVAPGLLHEVVHRSDVRVLHARPGPRLPREAVFQHAVDAGIGGVAALDRFDCYRAFEAGVPCAQHCTEVAGAERGVHAVASQQQWR